jgi:hypothetical protein
MVLILGLLGCLAARSPLPVDSAVPVTAVVTLVNAEAGVSHKPSADITDALKAGMMARGWTIQPLNVSTDFHQLGTSKRRTRWLMEHTDDSLSVLIETQARPRSELGGRFQWVVTASITVIGKEGDPLLHRVRLPTTLPHIHQGEREALKSVARQLATHTATQLARYQRGAE